MKGRCGMALNALKERFSGKAAAAGLAAALVMTPLGGATAQDAQSQQQGEFTQVAVLASTADASIAAGRYSETNPGVAVAVYLGTHPQTPSPERVREVLTAEFRSHGMTDPVTFFFAQNDVAGSGASFYLDGAVRGHYTLSQSRTEVSSIAQSYNFRKERGLLASLDYSQ